MSRILEETPTAVRYPASTIILLVIVTALSLIGAKNLYFRGDYKVFFEPTNPQRLAFEEMQNVFNKSENVAFMVIPKDGNVYKPKTLTLITELTDAAWQLPLSTRVESIANFQHTFDEDNDLVVEDLLGVLPESQSDAERIKQVVKNTPEIIGRLVSSKHDVAVIDTTIQLPDGDQTQQVIAIANAAKALKQELENKYQDHQIYLTGMVIMNNAFAESAQQDAETLVPLMFLLIFVSVAIILFSFWAAVWTMVVVFTSVGITVGLSGWYGIYLSTATVNAPTMITTLAVADCIHIIVGVKYFLSKGFARKEAIVKSISTNKKPIFITSVTTAIGFMMLNFSAVPVLAHLGNMTAFGVMLACLLSLTVLPSFLTFTPLSIKNSRHSLIFARWGNVVSAHYRLILPISFFAVIVISAFSFKNHLNDVAVEYFDDRSEFRQAVDVNEKKLGGMSNIDFVIYTDEPYGITSPAFLKDIENFAAWLNQQESVNHVLTFTDTLKRLNKNLNNDADEYFTIPETAELASQYLLLYEMSLPFGLDLGNQIDIDKSALRVIAVTKNLGSNDFTRLEQQAKHYFQSLGNDFRIEAASPPLMFAHIGERNMKSMVWGSVIALVLISVLIFFALKSFRLGVISLVTNLLPAAVGFGIWGLVSGEINMALSVVISMTMGIIVDDTVHFLSKYQMAEKMGKGVEQSILFAFESVGMALTTTTAVLVIGFSALASSSFMLNAHMGLMTIIIIIAALLVDFVFLPSLLLWMGTKAKLQKES